MIARELTSVIALQWEHDPLDFAGLCNDTALPNLSNRHVRQIGVQKQRSFAHLKCIFYYASSSFSSKLIFYSSRQFRTPSHLPTLLNLVSLPQSTYRNVLPGHSFLSSSKQGHHFLQRCLPFLVTLPTMMHPHSQRNLVDVAVNYIAMAYMAYSRSP